MTRPGDATGRGLGWPLAPSATGGLRETAAAGAVEQSMRLILGTALGERVMRPDFGCRLRSLAFAANDAATANLARHYVVEALRRWEPRIELIDVVAANDPAGGALVITVRYRLSPGAGPRELTFPFPLEQP